MSLIFRLLFVLYCTFPPGISDAAPSGDNLNFSRAMLGAAIELQRQGLQDAEQAFARIATPAAAKSLQQLTAQMFPATDARNSWSFFFNTAVFVFGPPNPPRQTVAFYHPWSDVFLLLDWEQQEDRFVITDAECVVGDWVRQGSPVRLQPAPLWLRSDRFGPLALGIATAESITAFEKTFWQRPVKGFRERILSLKERQLLEGNHRQLAASALLYPMLKIQILGERQEEDPVLAALATHSAQAVSRMRGGEWPSLLEEASETLPETCDVLRHLAPDSFADLVPVDYYLHENSWLIFLVPSHDSGYTLSLAFSVRDTSQVRLQRIDLISFAVLYANHNRLKSAP